MLDLVFNRTISISRSEKASDTAKGTRMIEKTYATGLNATIQPKRDRNLMPQNFPSAVGTMSADAMTTWKIIILGYMTPVEKNDVITDERGTKYKVEVPYINPFGNYLEGRIMTP